jgi:hypothetical protein
VSLERPRVRPMARAVDDDENEYTGRSSVMTEDPGHDCFCRKPVQVLGNKSDDRRKMLPAENMGQRENVMNDPPPDILLSQVRLYGLRHSRCFLYRLFGEYEGQSSLK